jgi:hypothetical protein
MRKREEGCLCRQKGGGRGCLYDKKRRERRRKIVCEKERGKFA